MTRKKQALSALGVVVTILVGTRIWSGEGDAESNPMEAPGVEATLARLERCEQAQPGDTTTSLEGEIERLRSELEEARREVHSRKGEIQLGRARLADESSAQRVSREEYDAVIKEKAALEEKQDAYISEIVQLNRKLKSVDQEVVTVQQGANQQRDELQTKFDRLLKTAKRFELELRRLSGVEEENAQLKATLAKLDTDTLKGKETIAQLEARLAQADEQARKIPELEGRAFEMQKRIEALTAQKEDLVRDLRQSGDRLSQLTAEYETTTKRKDTELAKVQDMFGKARDLLRDMRSEKEHQEKELVRLQAAADRLEKERGDLRVRADSLSVELTNRDLKEKSLRTDLEKALSSLKTAEERIVALEPQVAKISGLEEQVTTCEGGLKALQAQADKLEQLQGELVRIRGERTRLQNQLLVHEAELNSIGGKKAPVQTPPQPVARVGKEVVSGDYVSFGKASAAPSSNTPDIVTTTAPSSARPTPARRNDVRASAEEDAAFELLKGALATDRRESATFAPEK